MRIYIFICKCKINNRPLVTFKKHIKNETKRQTKTYSQLIKCNGRRRGGRYEEMAAENEGKEKKSRTRRTFHRMGFPFRAIMLDTRSTVFPFQGGILAVEGDK
jgi:hypothetical protein